MHYDIYKGSDIAEGFRRAALRRAPEGMGGEEKIAMTDVANAIIADVEYVCQQFERDTLTMIVWRPIGTDVPTVCLGITDDNLMFCTTTTGPPISADGIVR